MFKLTHLRWVEYEIVLGFLGRQIEGLNADLDCLLFQFYFLFFSNLYFLADWTWNIIDFNLVYRNKPEWAEFIVSRKFNSFWGFSRKGFIGDFLF